MESIYDNGIPAILINKKERKQLVEIRAKLEYFLNNRSEIILEEIRYEIAIHLTRIPNIYELERERANIYRGDNFNRYYLDLLEIDMGVKIITGKLFHEFVYFYGLIKTTDKGQLVLENLLKFKLIEWSINNDWGG